MLATRKWPPQAAAMTAEMWLIAAARVAGSLPVLRWPFYGALVAILVDQSDLFMMNLIHLGGVSDYQTFDKYLDQVYLALFLVVAWRWPGIERNVALALYVYRFAGFVAFEATGARWVLLLFPNLFEFWFVFIAARREFHLEERLPLSFKLDRDDSRHWNTGFITVLCLMASLKLLQEYVIHQRRLLDGFTAVDAVKSIWRLVAPF
jgi:hypothetical protein